jgi:hypothetical protein
MKTCATCKWFGPNRNKSEDCGLCFYAEPPWGTSAAVAIVSPELRPASRCSKWESKLERRCENCEFYGKSGMGHLFMECRRNPPKVEMGWPAVEPDQWCGEFRGRE